MIEHERTGWIDRISIGISRVCMWIPAGIVAIMVYEVVMRYVFEQPTLWVNEMSLWAAGVIYLTAGLYVMQQRGHIRIFILYDMVPRWLQRGFDVVSVGCIVLFATALVWGGSGEAIAKLRRWERFGTAWDPPIPATIKPLVLIMVVLIAMQAVSNLIMDWTRRPAPHTAAADVDRDGPPAGDRDGSVPRA